MMQRIYYRVKSASPVMRVIEQAIEKQRSANAALESLRVEVGAESIYTYGVSSFAGVKFTGDAPKGWKPCSNGICNPDLRTKAGKAHQVKIDALPKGLSAMGFSHMMGEELGGDWELRDYPTVAWTTFEKHGDTFILSVPIGCGMKPDGCDEMMMSEYLEISKDVEEWKGDAE